MKRTVRLLVRGDYKALGATVVASVRDVEHAVEHRVVARIGTPLDIPVEPGRWVVEVCLPSGERLTKMADVTVGASADVQVGVAQSPHEWLGLHQMLVHRGPLGAPPGASLRAARPPPPEVYAFDDWGTLSQEVRRVAILKAPLGVGDARRIAPRHHDGRYYLFELDPSTGGAPAGRPMATPRVAGVVIRACERVVVLPVAREWFGADGVKRATALTVDVDTGVLTPVVEDPRFALLLAYLAGGRSDLAAEALGELPEDLLYMKVQNPLAAAAGAYILIDQLYEAAQRPRWRQWIDNLSEWFPDVPDGAVLAGRALLHDGDVEGAARRFVEATERGIPFFAAGIRMLAAGFMSFGDAEAPGHWGKFHRARDDARRWATWLDPREPFAMLEPRIALETLGSTPTQMAVYP